MTAATAELGLEVSQALVTLVSVFGYGSLSLLFGLASFTSLRVSDLWDSLCLLEGDRTIKEEVRRRKIRKFASRHTSKEQSDNQTKNSNTEATLILCGYSGERANNKRSGRWCLLFEAEPKKCLLWIFLYTETWLLLWLLLFLKCNLLVLLHSLEDKTHFKLGQGVPFSGNSYFSSWKS